MRSFSSHIPVNITIFDRASYVGGRSTTVNAYNSPSEPVELGASIFVKVNHILVNASSAFNLSAIDAADRIPDGYSGPALGIWNGEDFVFTQSAAGDWWDTARLFWRYGIAPVKALRAMRASVGKFLTMYEAPVFPFQDLGEEVSKLGLIQDTGLTGEQLLREKGVGDLFAQELVQARYV